MSQPSYLEAGTDTPKTGGKCGDRHLSTDGDRRCRVGTDTFQDTGTDAESVCLGMSSELEKLEIDYIVWFVQGYDTKTNGC